MIDGRGEQGVGRRTATKNKQPAGDILLGQLTTDVTADDNTKPKEKQPRENFVCIKRGVRFWWDDILDFPIFFRSSGILAGATDLETNSDSRWLTTCISTHTLLRHIIRRRTREGPQRKRRKHGSGKTQGRQRTREGRNDLCPGLFPRRMSSCIPYARLWEGRRLLFFLRVTCPLFFPGYMSGRELFFLCLVLFFPRFNYILGIFSAVFCLP